MFKSVLFLMQVFLVKKKKPERDDVPVNPLVFPENDKHNEDIFFWGFPHFFSSRNHLTTERHGFSLDLLLKTFSDYDFRAASGPISVLVDKSQRKP